MRVLLTASRVDLTPAQDVAATAVSSWAGRATPAPISDGSGDLADVASTYLGGELGLLESTPVSVLTTETTWVADLAEVWDEEYLALLIDKARDDGAAKLVVNMPTLVRPNLGHSMLEHLGLSGVEELSDFLAGMDVLVTVPAAQPLLGVNGLPRLLARRGMMSNEEAQELEIDLGSRLPRPARRTLLGGIDAKNDFAGGGGGAALLLAQAGARLAWAGQWSAGLVDQDADLLVYVTGDIGLDMPRSLQSLAKRSQDSSIPAILVYREGALLRHELARFGLSGSYSYAGSGLGEAMEPIARTWLGPLH